MAAILITLTILYGLQIFAVVFYFLMGNVMMEEDEFKTKKQFFTWLIPFYKPGYYIAINLKQFGEAIAKAWKDLK